MSKIIGVTVGTSMSRPDWNQKDPKKAGYIENKPDDVEGISDERIQTAVSKHLVENPPVGGATAEQAAQIEANAKAIEELQEAPPGEPGKDGITPHIGENGNWYIGDTDTGKPSRGKDGSPGQDGDPGKDGTSATHTWNGTTLTVTSASGTSSADLVGPAGNPGTDGVSPTVTVSKSGKVTTIKITDAAGTKTATINDGADGGKGDPGSAGTSVTVSSVSESTADGGSNVVTFSDGKTLTVKNGSKGDTGATGPAGPAGATGAAGAAGADGSDYVLTEADKAEIAEMVDGATVVQAPLYVDSTDKMADTSRVYVLSTTGEIWAYMDTTTTDTVREDIDAGVIANSRLGSDGSIATDSAYAGYVATSNYIDLTAYPIPFTLHLEGADFLPEGNISYTRMATYDANKTKIACGAHYQTYGAQNGAHSYLNITKDDIVVDDNGDAHFTFNQAVKTNIGAEMQYIRLSGAGTDADAVKVYATYTGTITGGHWVNTGTSYAPALSDEDKAAIVEDVASMIDTQLLSVIGEGTVTV